MRIAFITPEYITEKNFDGGLANHLGRVCPMLVERGHQVIVIVASDEDGTFFKDGVEIHRVIVPSSGGPYWLHGLTFKRFREAKQWIRQSWALNQTFASVHRNNRIDIVQYSSYMATGLYRLKSVPSVIRLSSYERLLQQAYSLPESLNNRFKIYLEKKSLIQADAIFGPSNLVADAVMNDIGVKVQLIEPPFPDQLTNGDEKPFQDLLAGKKYLLFFGTVGINKGVPSIAEIIFPLLTTHPDLFFVFIGKDGGYLNHSMMEYVWKKAGSARGRVLYLGQMPQSQLYPILVGATAVVLPSRIDNLPNTCIEAMACNQIVIGTRGASFEQLIDDTVSGFLVSIDSPAELLSGINKALSLSSFKRLSVGIEAGRRISQLNPDIAVTNLISFYQSTIRSGLHENIDPR
jgi:glycosyltransferase involved in cell wall biosynthesis